jgi:monoamine oxidase
LNSGITIAWQNIPTQKGGWADWSKVGTKKDNPAEIMNTIRNGDRDFYVIGDQVSWLPGWKEGAVAVAQEVVAMVTKVKGFAMLQIEHVPDMKTLIQGHGY